MLYAIPAAWTGILELHFFTYALVWLLVFAIVYGLLEHYKMPKSSSARAVISLVFALLSLPSAASITGIISKLGVEMIAIVSGIMFFLILLELTGTKHKKIIGFGPKGEIKEEKKIHEKHTKTFLGIILILAVLAFMGAGGFEVIGIPTIKINTTLIFFLGVIAIAIWWMINEEKGG